MLDYQAYIGNIGKLMNIFNEKKPVTGRHLQQK